MHDFYANKVVKEQFSYDAMIRMCILKVLKGYIEYLTKFLRTAKGIDKEQNIVLSKAVVAGAAGPACAVPLFWPSMLSAVPCFRPPLTFNLSPLETRVIEAKV